MKQLEMLRRESKSYGGELLKTRKGRAHGRPLDTRSTMHLVLRSSKARGEWSFLRSMNASRISKIIDRFANKYGVRVLSVANVGNHLHLQIKLATRLTYRPFIRAVTAAIAMAVTDVSRWKRPSTPGRLKFWDYRPFTRVVQSWRGFLNLRDYLHINQLEGFGYRRNQARFLVMLQKGVKTALDTG